MVDTEVSVFSGIRNHSTSVDELKHTSSKLFTLQLTSKLQMFKLLRSQELHTTKKEPMLRSSTINSRALRRFDFLETVHYQCTDTVNT